MDVQVRIGDLRMALKRMAPAIPRASSLPILHDVLLEAAVINGEGQLLIKGTDLQKGARVDLPGPPVVREEGACTVPHKPLLDFLME